MKENGQYDFPMEIPRYWREMPVNDSFTGVEKRPKFNTEGQKEGCAYFKYPGGEIVLSGSFEEVYTRFEKKGFKPEVIENILFTLFGAVASEAAVSFEKIINSQSELVRGKVGKKGGSEVELGVDRLPRKITRKTLFAAGTNN